MTFGGFCLFPFFSWGGSGGGMPGMPHSIGCKTNDWLQGISSSFKKITLGVSVVILGGASIVQMLKGVGVSTVQ